MRTAIKIMTMAVVLSMIVTTQAFSRSIRKWEDVLENNEVLNICVEDIVNRSKNTTVSAAEVTKAVESMFAERKDPRFNVVDDKSKADLVFSGKIIEYIWMEKAPITNVYSPGALALDAATSGNKNYARMQLRYKISAAKTGRTLLKLVTQVTIKQPGVPEDKSYAMIYERTPKILAMDIFKRFKKKGD